MNKIKMLIIIIAVLFIFFAAVKPLALLWEHKWDALFVRSDRPNNSTMLHVYGRDNIQSAQGTIVFGQTIDCPEPYSERADVYIPTSGAGLRVRGVCTMMTPTPISP